LSSLSSGYKLTLDVQSREILSRGYDWADSVFDDQNTQFMKGIIYFSLGDYESRKFIFNPEFITKQEVVPRRNRNDNVE